MSIIGDIGDPKKDVEALTPLVDHMMDRLRDEIVPALGKSIAQELLNLTIVKKTS